LLSASEKRYVIRTWPSVGTEIRRTELLQEAFTGCARVLNEAPSIGVEDADSPSGKPNSSRNKMTRKVGAQGGEVARLPVKIDRDALVLYALIVIRYEVRLDLRIRFRDDVDLLEAGRDGFGHKFIKDRPPSIQVHRSFDRESADFRAKLRGERNVFRMAEIDQIDVKVDCLNVWQDCLASQKTKCEGQVYAPKCRVLMEKRPPKVPRLLIDGVFRAQIAPSMESGSDSSSAGTHCC
jgi:hypothetical protein